MLSIMPNLAHAEAPCRLSPAVLWKKKNAINSLLKARGLERKVRGAGLPEGFASGRGLRKRRRDQGEEERMEGNDDVAL